MTSLYDLACEKLPTNGINIHDVFTKNCSGAWQPSWRQKKNAQSQDMNHKAGKNLKVEGLNIYTMAKINYERNI